MNREMIESFLTTVDQQSVTAAAEALFVAQSTVSHRLDMLENEIGVQLFTRKKGFKKVELTSAGRNFIPLATRWIELDNEIHQPLTIKRKMVIGSMDSINQFLLSEILYNIKLKTPNISYQFISYHSSDIYSRIISNQIDIAFAFRPIHYELDAIPVFREPIYMIAPPNSIYPNGPIHPSELKKSNQIFFRWNPEIAAWNDEWWNKNEPPYVRVDSTALLFPFLKEPFNWALCPASIAYYLKERNLAEIHPFKVNAPNRICYMLKKVTTDDYHAKMIEHFVSLFNELLQNHPWKY